MLRRVAIVILMLFGASACSGQLSRAILGDTGQPGSARGGTPAFQPSPEQQPAPPAASGLPSPRGIEGGERAASVAGPGWYPLDVLRSAQRANATVVAGTMLHLDSSTSLAYAVYGVEGFDGDNFPTSVKVNLDSITGQYFVAFSDYADGVWKYAGPFNGSAEVQIPSLLPSTSPTAYVSSGMVHYFAIFPESGSQLTISSLSQGVDGGSSGPAAPTTGAAAGGDAGCIVRWTLSISQWDPDFSGYALQRAPLLSGDYSDAFAGVTTQSQYFDATAAAGTTYRWRVAALDVSGNRSPWLSFTGGGDVGVNLPPVVQCTIPEGKLNGPRTVTFDLSASFDPEGDPITEYLVAPSGGAAPISSPTPQIDVSLQPGCYFVMLGVKAGTTGLGMVQVKLYPQWRGSPVVVRAPSINRSSVLPAISYLRLFVDPSDGQQYTFGYDFTKLEYCVLANGVEHALPGYLWPNSTGEPVKSGDDIFCPVITSHTVMLLRWTPSANAGHGSGSLTQVFPDDVNVYDPLGANLVAAAPDAGGHIWVIYARVDGGPLNLYAQRGDGTATPITLVPNISSLDALDAQFNPGTGKIEIAGADISGLHWAEFDPVAGTLGVAAFIDLAGAQFVDLEINPTTNRPSLLYMPPWPADRYVYTERDTFGVWSAGVYVDNSATNLIPADMTFAGSTPYALFALSDNQGRLYQLSTAGGTVRNTPSAFAATGNLLSLQPTTGSDLRAAWRGSDGKTLHRTLLADGTDTDAGSWDATEGQGLQMYAAAAPDGLHVIWYSLLAVTAHHMLSTDGGASWTPLPDISSAFNLGLGSDKGGDLYLSYRDTGASKQALRLWNPGGLTWDDQGLDSACNNPSVHALLAASWLGDDIAWVRYDTSTSDIKVTTGNSGSPYFSFNFSSSRMPLWDGAATPGSLLDPFYALTVGGGPYPSGGYVSHYEGATTDPKSLYPPVGNTPHDLLTNRFTAGNNFGAAEFATQGILFGYSDSVFYATHGETMAPIRYQRGEFPEATALPLPANWSEFYERDLRRTVSAATLGGATAVAVIASLDGAEHYLEWSDFGHFEQLPMPGIGDGIRPVIFPGTDGRWHLIYKEPSTDRIMCLSTL